MTKELELVIQNLNEGLHKNFEKSGNIHPFFFAYTKDKNGKRTMFTCPVINMEMRKETAFIFGKELLKMELVSHVDAIAMVSEAWASVIEKGDPRYDNPMFVKPSEDPKRVEIAQVSVMTDSGESVFKAFEMKDKENKKKRSLVPFHEKDLQVETYLLKEFWKGYGVII